MVHQIAIEVGNPLHIAATDKHKIGRPCRLFVGGDDQAIVCDAEAAARIGPIHRRTAQLIGHHIDCAIQSHARNNRRPAIIIADVEAAPMARPFDTIDVAVQRCRQRAPVRTVAIHDVQLGIVIAEQLIIKSEIGDIAAIRRNAWREIRAVAIGELGDPFAIDGERVDFALPTIDLPIFLPVHRGYDLRSIGEPADGIACALRPAVMEIAVADLTRRPAFRRYNENMRIAGLEIASAICAVDKVGFLRQRVSPFRAFWPGGRFAKPVRLPRHEHCIGDMIPIGRPGEAARCVREARYPHRRAAIHPAHK